MIICVGRLAREVPQYKSGERSACPDIVLSFSTSLNNMYYVLERDIIQVTCVQTFGLTNLRTC